MVTRIAVAGSAHIARGVTAALSAHAALHDARDLELVLTDDSSGAPNWTKLGVDVVIDSSGHDARQHLAAGANKVLCCAPGTPALDLTVVYGVNHLLLRRNHRCVHAACCATHCIAPVARVLHFALGISRGMLTMMPRSDLYPGTDEPAPPTRVSHYLHRVLPGLENCFEDTDPVSISGGEFSRVGMVFIAQRDTTREEVNALIQCASFGAYADIVRYADTPLRPLVSDDDPHSCLFEANMTRVSGRVVKVCAAYRDDMGFCHRLIDTVSMMARV